MAIPCMLLFHLFFLFMVFSILELWCLDSMLSGIMLPRFHDSSFIYDVWHSAFWNYVGLDSVFLVSFTVFEFCFPHSGIMLPRFYVPFFCTVFAFWNYVASIP